MRVQDFTSGITALTATRRKEDAASYQAFVAIKHELDRLQARVQELEQFRLAITRQVEGSATQVKYFYLTQDLEVPMPEEAAGTLLFYLFLQDPTGGHTVTFPPAFSGLEPDHVSLSPDLFTSLAFYKLRPDRIVPAAFGPSGIITT